MNKEEAAKTLGVSVRTLENYVKRIQEREKAAGTNDDQRFKVRYVKGKTRDIADFNEDELARLKVEIDAPTAEPNKNREELDQSQAIELRNPVPTDIAKFGAIPQQQNTPLIVMTPEHLMTFADQLRKTSQNPEEVPLKDRTFLTVTDSAALSGVSVGAIEKAIKSGELAARRDLARGRRIKRSELEAWAEKL